MNSNFFKYWTCLAGLLALAPCTTRADYLTNLWAFKPFDRPYLGTNNAFNQRGLAYNVARNHVLIASREASNVGIFVLDADTGDDVHGLIMDGVSEGTFSFSMVGAAEDGAVYAANLSGSTTVAPVFRIYRWESDSPDVYATEAYVGDPAGTNDVTGLSRNMQRWGDTLDVRGAGTNTMIVAASRDTSVVAVFTTTDGLTFTPTIITNAASTTGSLGVAFGAGDTLWLKFGGQPLRHVSFDLATGKATLEHSFATTVFPSNSRPVAVDPANNRLAALVIETPDSFRLFDIQDLSVPPALLDRVNFPTDFANDNLTGAIDFGPDTVFALDSNNGVMAFRIVKSTDAPAMDTHPADVTALEGGPAVFTMAAKGTPPLQYQWLFNGTNLVGATNTSYTISRVVPENSGNYSVLVSNAAGSVTSSNAVLTVRPLVKSDAMTLLWRLGPGDRTYIANDNNQRGLAYNPATTNVVLVSRTGSVKIYVLDGNTGADRWNLNVDSSIIKGGTFILNMIGVADDGVVYACNLTTTGAGFTIYRWDNDSTNAVPMVAYNGDPGIARVGDTFDVRGSGVNTEILVGARNQTKVAIFTTYDGYNFSPNVITVDSALASNFGLGVAFGQGNTFWARASGVSLRQVEYELGTGVGTTLNNYAATNLPGLMGPLSIEPANQWLALIGSETPDNLRLYDISKLPELPILIDQELFATDNANANGTGAVNFGGGRLYALASNNGIVALKVQKPTVAPVLSAPQLAGANEFQFTLQGEVGQAYVIETTANWQGWQAVSTNIADAASITVKVPMPTGSSAQFYRALVQP